MRKLSFREHVLNWLSVLLWVAIVVGFVWGFLGGSEERDPPRRLDAFLVVLLLLVVGLLYDIGKRLQRIHTTLLDRLPERRRLADDDGFTDDR